MKVYLDTNILIGADVRPEHSKLKLLAISRNILLFKSYHGIIEQHHKVTMARREKDEAVGSFIRSVSREEAKSRFANKGLAEDKYVTERSKEQAEIDFWEGVYVQTTISTFGTLITTYGLFDMKGEMRLLGELMDKWLVDDKDSFQIMSAHSSGMDYFLTWDKKLINKVRKVHWLVPKAMTPQEFLAQVWYSGNMRVTRGNPRVRPLG